MKWLFKKKKEKKKQLLKVLITFMLQSIKILISAARC